MTAIDRLEGLTEAAAIKAPCRVSTTANITLAGLQTLDGVLVASGDRVLVWNQTTTTENGIYVAAAGDWTRDVDFDGTGDAMQGTIVLVYSGALYANTIFEQTTASPVPGTSAITFAVAGAAALALASSYMRTTFFPITTAALALAALGGLASSLLTTRGDLLVRGASVAGRLAIGTSGQFLTSNGTDPVWASPATLIQRSYLAGLGLSNNASPNTKIDVAAGECADSTNALMMMVSAATIDCGTVGANGLDAGVLVLSTWYHTYIIGKTDGTTSLIASTSATTPSPMPSGYTLKRRIGSFLTDGSAHIIAFTQSGDQFLWSVPITDVNAASTSTTAALTALTVPLGVAVTALTNWYIGIGATACYVLLTNPSQANTAPTATLFSFGVGGNANGTSACGMQQVLTDTSSQIRIRSSHAADTISATTVGWIDRRGRDA